VQQHCPQVHTEPHPVLFCRQGVANRDLKLENLLLDRPASSGGEWPLLKICDFGGCGLGEALVCAWMCVCTRGTRSSLTGKNAGTPYAGDGEGGQRGPSGG
jgi:serine/threonine protein kinase